MNRSEQATKMGGVPDEQAPHRPGAFSLSEAARTGWLRLAEHLVTTYQQCLTCVQPSLGEAERVRTVQATVERALQGNAAALAFIEASAEEARPLPAQTHESSWTEIGRAYAAAFTAAGCVALQAPESSPRIPSLAPELARLALRAAETLAHGVGLLLGTRQSGSIAQVCTYIGSLENQSDTLLRGFLTAPVRKDGNAPWQEDPQRSAAERQMLIALETMTDRCEDIGDALLVIAHHASIARAVASTVAKEDAHESK